MQDRAWIMQDDTFKQLDSSNHVRRAPQSNMQISKAELTVFLFFDRYYCELVTSDYEEWEGSTLSL